MSITNLHESAPTWFQDVGDVRFAYRRFGREGAPSLVCLQHFSRLASFDKAALAGAKTQINRATLPPDADFLEAYAEYVNSLARPGFRARLPTFAKRIAEHGLDDVERRLGDYIGIGNQQP
jgi:hypothetical protein